MSIYKALTIAGSDSGGGAGIQADLKTFQELGVYGMSVITAVTAQNTQGVQGVFPMSAQAVEQQLASIGADLRPDALKTGMLFSSEIIQIVAAAIESYKWERVVVDPVMIAKGGASLLQQEAIDAMIEYLLPLADVVTPNIPEAEALSGISITDSESRQQAARKIHAYGCQHVMIKGGHEADSVYATDLLYDGKSFTEYSSRRLHTPHTHGTGCTFAAAITSGLAQGLPASESLHLAKNFIQAAIAEPLYIGSGHGPTNHWAYQRGQRLEGAVSSNTIIVSHDVYAGGTR
ncbi:bifunctional hydroxymethylpyrimidine kinase/phosphomethylpyrimidine kinase [Paenibacillus chondroitinus]|uniref:Hydroxymethylpyrimidine/phosphomethylpyrimidine kinase n=1 Tax=Paenibacillus chondroitinus TaxID=59842 RepID=A0ABU6DK15_9BACL|nr:MULTISPECIES: bifunctional hydroxymethylpyrimidine kinase/phosphomethylpyrimidine kinase [Paenibacillus]MCY9657650.1 bifunctional hydroxymethylpyrimidine kinase/phosphomethylpyrimidine kinase [Paenibacillus anseongense]MEB4798105.1 bifunctional hydroxymethylpyrimidine kinase/phosphomethylpyrimidine kinase [Paenibacillus chondroitinus]